MYGLNLQSRCFFLGALTSCVVALHTALLMAEPLMLCCAAAILSVMDCPDMICSSGCVCVCACVLKKERDRLSINGRIYCRDGERTGCVQR